MKTLSGILAAILVVAALAILCLNPFSWPVMVVSKTYAVMTCVGAAMAFPFCYSSNKQKP